MNASCDKYFFLFLVMFGFYSCSQQKPSNNSTQNLMERRINELLPLVGSVKTIDSYDAENCNYYDLTLSSPGLGFIKHSLNTVDVKEGSGTFKLIYNLSAKPNSSSYVRFMQKWGDFRSDLSFEPLAISIWVKGNPSNKGVLRFVLLQDETLSYQPATISYFEFTDNKILSKNGWNRLVIPYEFFKILSGTKGTETLRLDRVFGYAIDIVNNSNENISGEFYIDNLEQLTSHKPNYGKPRFSSIFIQLTNGHQQKNWDIEFSTFKSIGINTWIIQYSHSYGNLNTVSWYSDSRVPWNATSYPLIDSMFAAAERQGVQLIIGLNGDDYDNTRLSVASTYDKLFETNRIVANELNDKFGSSSSFAGWYITQEFHDGTYPAGWLTEPAKTMLANYLQRIASYAKSKKNIPVIVAPAIWRGVPADKSAQFFKDVFVKASDIDECYFQDVGGRCLVDVDVDLPNYYKHLKKACEESNVTFGVDVESFLECGCAKIGYRSQTWDELKEQLFVAGIFTNRITNFSYTTFSPGSNAFEGYRNYIKN